MDECRICRAFLIHTMIKDKEWIDKASFSELMNAPADVRTFHCPQCKRTITAIVTVSPKK